MNLDTSPAPAVILRLMHYFIELGIVGNGKFHDVYAIVKYTILRTEETKMCKLTKILPIHGGLLDFQDSGEGFDKGRGRCRGRWVETPVGPMLSDI